MTIASKKIAFVANTARSFLLFRADLIQHYARQGHKVYCLAPEDGTAGQEIESLGATFKSVPMSRSGSNPIEEAGTVYALYRHLSVIRPDHIISYTIKPNTYAPVIAALLNIPSLAVVTGLGYAFMSRSFKAKVASKVFLSGLSHADSVWFLNEADRTVLTGIAPKLTDASDILPGEGIDPDYYAPQPKADNAKTVFLMIARLLKDKGILEYAAAARQIRLVRDDVEFHVLGGLDAGNPTGLTQQEWDNIVEEGDIAYLGAADDVRPYIAQADCIVLPSYREGLPRVLLEGASMSRPMVATDVPGCADIVRDGTNGFLCKAFDSVSLADSMGKFLALNDQERMEMGRNARQTVLDMFSTKVVTDKFDSLILAG